MDTIKRISAAVKHLVLTGQIKRHPYLAMSMLSVFLFVFSTAGLIMVGAKTIGPSDVKIVDIYEDGNLSSVPTRAKTVGELVERLDIELAEADLLEPARDTEILEDNFQLNIYKARPVSVKDGDETKRILSPYSEPRLIAKDAGIDLAAEDIASWTTSTVEQNQLTPSIEILRANLYTINLYGTIFQTRSHSVDVGEVLAEAGVVSNEGDVISPALGSQLVDGQAITISLFGTQVITVQEPVEFEIISSKDANLPIGTVNITKPGVKGVRTVTYEVQLENDIEISRKVIQQVVTKQPETQEQVVGSKVTSTLDNVELGRQIATELGYGNQFDCIYNIYARESGWNHTARNANSGAYGIPQALPGSKMGPGWQTDPAVQIRWGIGYMVGRYGSPCGAYNFWQANHWY